MADDVYSDLPRIDFRDSADPTHAKIYSVITTWDGSPTLAIRAETAEFDSWIHERMHHPKGAWTETLYVYGQALDELEKMVASPSVYVVGLGCGYIEMLTVARWLSKFREANTQIKVRSFESDPFLIEGFRTWMYGTANLQEEERFRTLHEVLRPICEIIAKHFRISKQLLRETMQAMHAAGTFILDGALNTDFITADVAPAFKASAIFYDAFSSKTDPYLWEEPFLFQLMDHYFEKTALFATYAARGVLNRVLTAQKFKIRKIEGYGGKRESTFGLRFETTAAPEAVPR